MNLSKRGKVYHYRFQIQGRDFSGSTKTGNKARAMEVARTAYDRAWEMVVAGHLPEITLGDLYETWFAAEGSHHESDDTWIRQKRRLFGEVRGRAKFSLPKDKLLSRLKEVDVKRLVDARVSEGYAANSIRLEIALLRKMVGWAQGRYHYPESFPWPSQSNDRRLKIVDKFRHLTLEEEQQLLTLLHPAYCKPVGQKPSQRSRVRRQQVQDAYDLAVLILDTGMRPWSEAAALLWSSVDFADGLIHIYRTKVQTKHRHGMVRMTDRLWEVLERRRENVGQHPSGVALAGTYVFPSTHPKRKASDTPWLNRSDHLTRTINAMGLNEPHLVARGGEFTPHSFRDTFATRLVQAGVPITSISVLLGHNSVTMTEKYAHLAPSDVQDVAAEVLNKVVAQNSHNGRFAVLETTR